MTGAAHVHQLGRRRIATTTWSSHRLAGWVALAASALLLLLGGFALATHLRAHAPSQQQIEVPMLTSPGAHP